MSNTSDYVYMLSGMIYDGATEEDIQHFLRQVPSELRDNVLAESKKSADTSRRDSRMDATKRKQANDWGN